MELNSNQFSYSEEHHYSAEASSLGITVADPIPLAIIVVSKRTGKKALFALSHVEMSSSGDVMYWEYTNGENGRLTIFND